MAETIGNIVGAITGSLVSITISIALFAFTVWAIWTIVTSAYRSTGAKVLWVIACLIFPFLGPLCWLIFGYKKNPTANDIVNNDYSAATNNETVTPNSPSAYTDTTNPRL